MKFTVLITTYNRADHLRRTLESLAGVSCSHAWEVNIVDNNSSDETKSVVTSSQNGFPVPLTYLFEPTQGKPAALNTGIRHSRGAIIAMTDDDVRVEPDWLEKCAEGFARFDCDYVGGRVLPMWESEPPRWFRNRRGRQWAVIALLDYGRTPVEVGCDGVGWPLGANMAVKADAFDRAGLWDNRFGRQGNTLRGQEQRDWCLRARAAGLRGYYLPEMLVHHHVPKARLTKHYFRDWFYWNGISRAILYDKLGLDMDSPDESIIDYGRVHHIAGVPRYMWRSALATGGAMIKAALQGEPAKAFEHELSLWFFAGVVRQRWRDRSHGARRESVVVGR